MSMTDPIADLLTRVRNANSIGKKTVAMPYSHAKESILTVLKREGFIADFEAIGEGVKRALSVILKYGPEGEKVIIEIRRVSKPGRRIYWKIDQVKPVLDGLGIAVLTTSKGVLSDREARKARVGGEVLCTVW